MTQRDPSAAVERVLELEEAIDSALTALGTGKCAAYECPGCKVERATAIAMLSNALRSKAHE